MQTRSIANNNGSTEAEVESLPNDKLSNVRCTACAVTRCGVQDRFSTVFITSAISLRTYDAFKELAFFIHCLFGSLAEPVAHEKSPNFNGPLLIKRLGEFQWG